MSGQGVQSLARVIFPEGFERRDPLPLKKVSSDLMETEYCHSLVRVYCNSTHHTLIIMDLHALLTHLHLDFQNYYIHWIQYLHSGWASIS